MKILCRLFGHIPNPGYGRRAHAGAGYFKVCLAEKDGLGTQHATLHTVCERCGDGYQIGRIHVPVLKCLTPLQTSIRERILCEHHETTFRGTPDADFKRVGDDYYLCTAWFEDGAPRLQIRGYTHSLDDTLYVQQAIELAKQWFEVRGYKPEFRGLRAPS